MRLLGLISCLALLAGGCGKKAAAASQPAAPQATEAATNAAAASAGETIARLHWLGKQRLAGEPNAAHFMLIWKLPESARLEQQTLDKLSLGVFGIPNDTDPAPGQTNSRSLTGVIATNLPSAQLRPLLDDLVQSESYVEIRAPSSAPAPTSAAPGSELRTPDSGLRTYSLALAIRLSPDRAGLWETNLASLQAEGKLPGLTVARAGDWTLLGYAASGTNHELLNDFATRIQRDHAPFAAPATNLWIDANFDPHRLAQIFAPDWKLPAMIPQVALTVTGDGSNVLTHAQLDFPQPLPFQIEPWNIPTNLIHGPLHTFAAIRGFRPWLSAWKGWQELGFDEVPNQVFLWAQQPAPFLTYAAAPDPAATNTTQRIADYLVAHGNPWLSNNAWGAFERSPAGDGLKCTAGSPLFVSFLRADTEPGGEFLLAGLNPTMVTTQPVPDWITRDLGDHSDIVAFEREVTGARVGSWVYLGQALRLLFYKAQLPTGCASLQWLRGSANLLGNCQTVCRASSPRTITVDRTSSVGFDSVELHLIADWLESPRLPEGLHTLLAPGLTRPWSHSHTKPTSNLPVGPR